MADFCPTGGVVTSVNMVDHPMLRLPPEVRGVNARELGQRRPQQDPRGVRRIFLLSDGHTVSNAPDFFRPPKLRSTGHGKYSRTEQSDRKSKARLLKGLNSAISKPPLGKK